MDKLTGSPSLFFLQRHLDGGANLPFFQHVAVKFGSKVSASIEYNEAVIGEAVSPDPGPAFLGGGVLYVAIQNAVVLLFKAIHDGRHFRAKLSPRHRKIDKPSPDIGRGIDPLPGRNPGGL